METKAFVLIETKVGKAREVAGYLKEMANGAIESVDVVTGPYDLIVVVKGKDIQQVGVFVGEEMPTKIPNNLLRTVTCVAV